MELEDQQTLEKTQRIRNEVVDELMDGGAPRSKEDREFLVKLLDGMDRVAINRSKIKAEEKTAKANGETNNIIANILRRVTANTTHEIDHTVKPPELPNDLHIEVVPGETHIGTTSLDLDDIIGTS